MFWDEVYKGTPPWDIDHPQPAFQALIESGDIRPGRALDIGCGRGENAIMLAVNGCDVTGIDLAKDAISDAKAKAIERHVKINFVVGNVLEMDHFFTKGEFDRCEVNAMHHDARRVQTAEPVGDHFVHVPVVIDGGGPTHAAE